jgi:hypothetical protein
MSDVTGSGPMDRPAPAEILDHGAPSVEAVRRRRWPAVAGAAAVLVVGSAGVALGMALSGGGAQPEELMPASTLVYADVDFDPGAEQKVNLLRLLQKFPEIRDELGDRSDIKQILVEELLGDSGQIEPEDVTPWLGDRAGVGMLWDDEAGVPVLVVVLQVTDEDAAAATLSDRYDDSKFAFENGFVVLTPGLSDSESPDGMDAAQVVAEATAAPLSERPQFRGAMDSLGDGLASMYVDADAMSEIIDNELGPLGFPDSGSLGMGPGSLGGQLGAVVRVEPSAVELVGRTTQVSTGLADDPTNLFAGLPSSTAAAVALGGGGDAVAAQWEQLLQQLDSFAGLGGVDTMQPVANPTTGWRSGDPKNQFERAIARLEAEYNVRLPDDLITLFGDDMVLALDGDELVTVPRVGLRSVTDPAAAADLATRLQPVIDDLTAGFGITVQPVADGLVVASTPEYAQELASGEGALADEPRVQRALPELDQASAVLWVDFDVLGDIAGLADASAGDVLEPLEALGMASGVEDGGEFARIRLTFDD